MIQFGDTEHMDLRPCSATYPWDHIKFDIDSKESYLIFDPEEWDYQEVSEAEWLARSTEYELIENDYLSSDCTKIVLRVNEAYYTLFHDLIPFVMKMFEYDPSTYFILHRPIVGYGDHPATPPARDATVKFVIDFFDAAGVKYYFHDSDEPTVGLKFNNRLSLDKNREKLYLTSGDIKDSMDYVISQILSDEEKAISPHRKVYLSRLHLRGDRGQIHGTVVPGGKNRYNSDIRIENEEVLIEYFKSKGYEILVPEETFTTFQEQIKYFNEVKILVGLTGTGLSNGILMQEGQVVVDITSELVFGDETYGSSQAINSEHYLNDAYMQKHLFVSVPSRRDPYEVVERFKQIENLLNL